MSELIVYTYNRSDKAGQVLETVASLKQENVQKALIGIEDAAVVVKDDAGEIKVRQTLESAVKGGKVVTTGLWGVLIGFLFGGPLFGALVGMGIGALFGRNIDIGINNDFIKGIGDDLSPGDSALFLLVKDTPVETITAALSGHGGTLYHSTLSDEATEAFSQAGEQDAIREAIEEQSA